MRDHRPYHRLATAEREAVLDQILTNLWKGKLSPAVATSRFMIGLSMSHRDVLADRLSPQADLR